MNFQTDYSVDKENKKITVKRAFAAPVAKVWSAWTTPEILDQWWAPKPWKANTVSMNFSEGGRWLYYMASPEGEKHYCLFDYKTIKPEQNYAGLDAFCSEAGEINTGMPRMNWNVNFGNANANTMVTAEITFDKLEDLEKIVEMGFKEGFAMGHSNLDEWLANNQ